MKNYVYTSISKNYGAILLMINYSTCFKYTKLYIHKQIKICIIPVFALFQNINKKVKK